MNLPEDIEKIKEDVLKEITPICSAVGNTEAESNFLFSAQRTDAGRELPPYYLCYFLFVDLLGFKNLGQFEKISWSVPIDYKGTAYLLEHRKLGFGLFAADKESQEHEAKEIVKIINKSVRKAKLYFEWRADQEAKDSNLNVVNLNYKLYGRFEYFLNDYKSVAAEAKKRKNEHVVTKCPGGGKGYSFPGRELAQNGEWLAIAAIDAFFSWTEHIFIHAAILNGKVTTGEKVADLADDEWVNKFRAAIDTTRGDIRPYYDQLIVIKRQIRNYLAHGAFGKSGEAFQMHSGAGAVPLLMPHQKGKARFTLQSDLGFDEKDAIKVIEGFLATYWSSEIFPAVAYIQSGLDTILTYTKDGTYASAMKSKEDMDQFLEYLSYQHDCAANMDW